jgi:adenylylsulfate kinase
MADHIHPIFDRLVARTEKELFLNQKAQVFWFTGLSGSGKSTIAETVERELFNQGHLVQVLDGDNIRTGICNNLTFSLEDRKENIRRISEVSKLMINAGVIALNSFVSPTNDIRAFAKSIIGGADFHLIYVKASVETCEARDVKGLYKKARAGIIKGFTGIDSPFDEPTDVQLILDTETETKEESVKKAVTYIKTYI